MEPRIERIELGEGGRIELREHEGSVSISLAAVAGARSLTHRLVGNEGGVSWALHPRGDRLLLGRLRSGRLHLLRLPEGAIEPIELDARLANAWQLAIETSGELFVVLTESGVYAIDAEGRERWRISGTTYDWRYVGDHEGDVWLADTNGNLLGFDARTGAERSL